jgi:hypothetical protein
MSYNAPYAQPELAGHGSSPHNGDSQALEALKASDKDTAVFEIECSLQTLGEDVRDELGLYEWNREGK